MSLTRKLVLSVVLPAMAAPVVVLGAATSAEAYPIICDPGTSWTKVGSPTRVNQVTHMKGMENFTGSTATRTATASRVTTIEASVSTTYSVSAEVSASIFKVFSAKASSSFGITVAAKGSKTNTSSESVTWTMKPGDSYVFYAGSRKVTAHWTRYRCNGNGTDFSVTSSGSAKSFYGTTEGGVACKATPPVGTMAYVAKVKYC